MQRINGPNFVSTEPAPTSETAGGYFAYTGNPNTSTNVTPQWLNSVQDEIVNVIEAAGITLSATANNQMLTAISAIINSNIIAAFPNQLTGGDLSSGYQKLANGLVIQWGENSVYNSPHAVVFPIAFPNQCFVVVVCEGNANAETWLSNAPTLHGVSAFTKTQYQGWALLWNGSTWLNTTAPTAQNYIAIGY